MGRGRGLKGEDYQANGWKILVGDCRARMRDIPDESIHMIWTSPPYFGLRDYGDEDQIGLEPTPEEFVESLVEIFRECKRVLRDDGTLWLNLGDSYAANRSYQVHQSKHPSMDYAGSNAQKVPDGLKPKDLIGIPWRAAFALQADGWYLRQEITWAKGISMQSSFGDRVVEEAVKQGVSPEKALKIAENLDLYVGNPMPESVRDRCSAASESLFLFAKSERYFFDNNAVREPSSSDHPSGNKDGYRRGERLSYTNPDGSPRGNVEGWKISPKRNLRNVWCIPTKPFRGAHFATAPEALVEPCIKAGTSEGGCCPECGAPYSRVLEEKGGTIQNEGTGENLQGDRKGPKAIDYDRLKIKGAGGITPKSVETLGFEPSCDCNSTKPPIPATVLDPFCGAATTLLTAEKLERSSIGIELNDEYAQIAVNRLEDYARETNAPWEEGYIPEEVEDPEEVAFGDLFGDD